MVSTSPPKQAVGEPQSVTRHRRRLTPRANPPFRSRICDYRIRSSHVVSYVENQRVSLNCVRGILFPIASNAQGALV